jgi:L-asparaginase II
MPGFGSRILEPPVEDPVLVEALRGAVIESRHRGAVAVCDADGAARLTIGDAKMRVFPRSAAKPIQALPLVESGAADQFGLDDRQLALACASHNGEPGHIAVVEALLARSGHDVTALECGAHWPVHQPSAHALARAGAVPSALHNNCSGQHAGFLCLAGKIGVDGKGYVAPDHPVQREATAALEGLLGISLGRPEVDGCSIPTYAMPLDRLATAFARFCTGHGMQPQRAQAARRLLAACAAQPWYLAGTGRFCTTMLERLKGRVLTKIGAEGVLVAALPELGLGIAIKCDDGAGRAAEVIMATLIARLLPLSAAEEVALLPHIRPPIKNCNDVQIGALRPTSVLERAS